MLQSNEEDHDVGNGTPHIVSWSEDMAQELGLAGRVLYLHGWTEGKSTFK